MASKKTAEPTEPQTFEDPPRSLESVTVDSRTLTEKSLTVTWSNGWTYLIPDRSLEKHFPVGAHVIVETVLFSEVVGLKVAGVWVWRKSDEQRAAQQQAYAQETAERQRKDLEENREDWAKRTAELPDWLRDRLQGFVDDPEQGEEFQLRDWRYELGASELAALYEKHPEGDDAPEVNAYAHKHGTTGFMHGWAAAAARAHAQEVESAKQAAAEATATKKR